MDSVKTDFNDNRKVVNVTLHKNYLKDDDFIFVKASHGMHLEKILEEVIENIEEK